MFWSYRDGVQRSTSEKFLLLEETKLLVKCWKGQNHENFKTTEPWGNKGKILCGGSFFKPESCGLRSEESVSTYLSSSACDKPLAPGHLPKWRGVGGCLCREFCYSMPQLNEIIYHTNEAQQWGSQDYCPAHVQAQRHCFVSAVHGLVVQYKHLFEGEIE